MANLFGKKNVLFYFNLTAFIMTIFVIVIFANISIKNI